MIIKNVHMCTVEKINIEISLTSKPLAQGETTCMPAISEP